MKNQPIMWTRAGNGAGLITKTIPSVTAGDPDKLDWTIDVVIVMSGRKDAESIEDEIPGAGEYLDRAVDGPKDSVDIKIRPGVKAGKISIQAEVTTKAKDGTKTAKKVKVLESHGCEIRHGRARMTSKAQVQELRLKLLAVDRGHDIAGEILGRQVLIGLQLDQTELLDTARVNMGDIVSFKVDDVERFARVQDYRPNTGEIDVDDFGETTTLLDSQVVQRLAVQSEGAEPIDVHLDNYRAACVETGAEPRWADLVEAAAQAAAQGNVTAPTGNSLYVNGNVVEQAAASSLPAEA